MDCRRLKIGINMFLKNILSEFANIIKCLHICIGEVFHQITTLLKLRIIFLNYSLNLHNIYGFDITVRHSNEICISLYILHMITCFREIGKICFGPQVICDYTG
jgi:hypothetical protein